MTSVPPVPAGSAAPAGNPRPSQALASHLSNSQLPGKPVGPGSPGAPSRSVRPKVPDAVSAPVLAGLLEGLADRVISDASGTGFSCHSRLPFQPQKNLWLGMLASEQELALLPKFIGEKRVPPAHGFTFRVASLPIELDVTVQASLYLPLLPTAEEQRKAAQSGTMDNDNDATGSGQGTGQGGSAAASISLTELTTKVDIEPVRLTLPVNVGLARHGEPALQAALARAVQDAHRATLGLFRPPVRRNVPRPDNSDYSGDTAWAAYCTANLTAPADLNLPTYGAAVEVEARQVEGYAEVTVTLVNTTPPLSAQYADVGGTVPWPAQRLDLHLYQAALQARTSVPVLPIELEQVRASYRYDRTVPVFGEATAAEHIELSDGTHVLKTCYGADARTKRMFPRRETLGGHPIYADFATLIGDPVPAVQALVDAADAWVEQNWSASALDRLHQANGWTEQVREQADDDARSARDEVVAVREGLAALTADSELLAAFKQAMRAMQVIGVRKDYSELRLFQLAWLVMCLPGVRDPATQPMVDIVWFATGGGKSEAYLGLMLVTLFHARRTGVTAGSLVWARFPLRLLSLQQTERFAEVLAAAEQIRLADPVTSDGTPFSVGYFVGSGNTPNRFYAPGSPYSRVDPADSEVRKACRVLDFCPTCGGQGRAGAFTMIRARQAAAAGKVPSTADLNGSGSNAVSGSGGAAGGARQPLRMHWDETTWQMEHVCDAAGCPTEGPLPVYVIDDEIYRRLPSVLVGTVDKLAQIAMQKHFANLLGKAASRCPQHGYTADPAYCAVYGCQVKSPDRLPAKPGLSGLRLEIADELHLLDEELGALDGMYETLLGSLNTAVGNAPLRIVGATATLEGYKEQAQHLYQRDGRRFPVNGPTTDENFWTYTDPERPLRQFLGLRPRRISHVVAAVEVALTHRQWLTELAADPRPALAAAGLDVTDEVVRQVADDAAHDLYDVLLAYCLRNDDLGQFIRDERLLNLHGPQNWAQINGDADPSDIRESVRRLVDPASYPPEQQVRTVVATKAIGHGFDVARLGVMVMIGTPTQASEVIQASARVGRTHPGLVVNLANPSRDRDVSTHRFYAHWIRYLDRLINKVPVNRESLPVLRRVLPAALMAWLLQHYDRGWITAGRRNRTLRNSDQFRAALNSGYLTPAKLAKALQDGLGLHPTSGYHELHRQTVEQWVDETARLVSAQGNDQRSTPDMLDPRVPTSLRDVEDPIPIHWT